jgi:hypothetical protein
LRLRPEITLRNFQESDFEKEMDFVAEETNIHTNSSKCKSSRSKVNLSASLVIGVDPEFLVGSLPRQSASGDERTHRGAG